MKTDDTVKRNRIFKNYWKAISNVLNKNLVLENSALFKTIGLDLFNQISPTVFSQLFLNKNFKVEVIEKLLEKAFEKLDSDFIKVGMTEFWLKGKDASGLNKAGIRKYATELDKAISISLEELTDIEL
jgi:hypothetical protein